jgi:hypothetical protein
MFIPVEMILSVVVSMLKPWYSNEHDNACYVLFKITGARKLARDS